MQLRAAQDTAAEHTIHFADARLELDDMDPMEVSRPGHGDDAHEA